MPIRVLNADIIFRNGSNVLASLVSDNITHGGFDSGDGEVHDIGGSGIQTVTVDQFYAKAVTSTKRRVSFRQTNYMAGRIWEAIYDNVNGQRFDNPTGVKPWNLFTTSDNYTTANCLEWLQHQWQRAVREVHAELNDTQQKTTFESAYYDGSNVKTLVPASLLTVGPGDLGFPETIVAGLITAANALGKGDIDGNVFHNEYEGDFIVYYPGYYGVPLDQVPLWVQIVSELQEQGELRTITPKSYTNSPFYEEVPY